MTISLDPEGVEREIVLDFAGDLTGKRLLEVGCGDGRLTWRIATRAAAVVGIDPDANDIEQARRQIPAHLHQIVNFQQTGIESYTLAPQQAPFDRVLFSWSLC
jgi:magnesium-protoporphyrin O-methyltransferase